MSPFLHFSSSEMMGGWEAMCLLGTVGLSRGVRMKVDKVGNELRSSMISIEKVDLF
jgi:hypothetical protein